MALRPHTRATIVDVAARLLQEQGAAAVTTRGVAQAAGVQAPAIYRLFGDKDGLLDAVAEHVMATYVATKATIADSPSTDPLADLRAGWDLHVDFGLANPALFRLLTGPGRATPSPAAARGLEVLRSRVRRVAEAGRLRVGERRAVELVHAAGTGAVLTLLATPPEGRDPHLADAMYEAVSRAILTDAPTVERDDPIATVVAFRALAPRLPALSEAERALMSEWLDRAIDELQRGPRTGRASTSQAARSPRRARGACEVMVQPAKSAWAEIRPKGSPEDPPRRLPPPQV
jgi:AcrR family transcriptional regulator